MKASGYSLLMRGDGTLPGQTRRGCGTAKYDQNRRIVQSYLLNFRGFGRLFTKNPRLYKILFDKQQLSIKRFRIILSHSIKSYNIHTA